MKSDSTSVIQFVLHCISITAHSIPNGLAKRHKIPQNQIFQLFTQDPCPLKGHTKRDAAYHNQYDYYKDLNRWHKAMAIAYLYLRSGKK